MQEDVVLGMLLTSSSGKNIIMPCYYGSGESGNTSKWKAHFAAQETGNYTYSFQLTKANQIISTCKQASFQSEVSEKKGFLHTKNNWVLEFDNGKPFRGIGENISWESRANDDSKFFKELCEKEKYNYGYMLPSLAKHGGNFLMKWIMFNSQTEIHLLVRHPLQTGMEK